jgi:hypothetical protein
MKIIAHLSERNYSYHFLLRESVGQEFNRFLTGFPIFMAGKTSNWRSDLENENHKLRVPVKV